MENERVISAMSKIISSRSFLIKEAEKCLVQAFIEKGFNVESHSTEKDKSFLKWILPLGTLRRERNGDMDVVEIQFDKYGSAKFVINFGTIPKEGVTTILGDHAECDVAGASDALESYRLYSSSWRPRWFGLGLFSPKNEKPIISLIDKAIILSGEINNWFEQGRVGKHMRRF